MKTKLTQRSSNLWFDDKSCFNTILDFTPNWDFKPHHTYASETITKLSTTIKIHIKCDVIDGSVANCLGQPLSYSFFLDKSPGYKVFCQAETIHYEKNLF